MISESQNVENFKNGLFKEVKLTQKGDKDSLCVVEELGLLDGVCKNTGIGKNGIKYAIERLLKKIPDKCKILVCDSNGDLNKEVNLNL